MSDIFMPLGDNGLSNYLSIFSGWVCNLTSPLSINPTRPFGLIMIPIIHSMSTFEKAGLNVESTRTGSSHKLVWYNKHLNGKIKPPPLYRRSIAPCLLYCISPDFYISRRKRAPLLGYFSNLRWVYWDKWIFTSNNSTVVMQQHKTQKRKAE